MSQCTFKTATEKKIFSKFFCLLLFEALASFFKDKKSSRSCKTVGIEVFSYLFCLMIEGSADRDPDLYLVQMDTDRGGPKTSGSATLSPRPGKASQDTQPAEK
jgi:hypothetical protein